MEIEYKFNDCLELQLIDTNCSNCIFMERDLIKFKSWEQWHRDLALKEFERLKAKAIADAQQVIDAAETEHEIKSGKGMMFIALKMRFQFDKKGLPQYGKCTKLIKEVSFIPQICMPENKNCFKHRKEE